MGANKEKAKMHTLHRKALEKLYFKIPVVICCNCYNFRVLVMLNMI